MLNKIFTLVILMSVSLSAQLLEDNEKPLDIHSSIFNQNPSGFLIDFFASDKFQMNHSVEMSYSAMGSQGVALGVYTNSMSFQFANNLRLEVDASMVNSPYNSYGDQFTKNINGIYLSRARLTYQASEDMNIIIQYNKMPYNYYGYGSYYRNPFGGFFNRR